MTVFDLAKNLDENKLRWNKVLTKGSPDTQQALCKWLEQGLKKGLASTQQGSSKA